MIETWKDRKKEVDKIIIHSMGESINGMFAPDFLNSLGLSAHFFIDSAGNTIYGVDHEKIAFHAGESEYKGETDLNKTSIGIELLVAGDHDWNSFKEAIKDPDTFTADQYKRCARLCRQLMNIYPITKDRILRHSEVSGPDVRDDYKIDPGTGFDMQRLKDLI